MSMRAKRPLREPVRDAPGPKLKNYITPDGLQRLKDEHRFLLNRERTGGHEGGDVGGRQRRSQRERGLHVRQAAPAADRFAHSFSLQAH
jgi:hypothetical protein